VVVGAVGGLAYLLVHWLLPSALAGLLAVAATAAFTGGLHEDGLADTVDGFGGGADKPAKLAIMKDSRIGSFGLLAILVAVALRAGALAVINGGWRVAGALVAVHALSRAAMPIAMFLLPPAREDGLGHGAGKPTITDIGIGATIALVATALVMPSGRAIAAVIGAAAGTVAVIVLARRQIGGQTGDVLGAVQQIAEIGALLGVVAATPHLT
jgi:adenosylcobinamide-GDP ribazoletransferase